LNPLLLPLTTARPQNTGFAGPPDGSPSTPASSPKEEVALNWTHPTFVLLLTQALYTTTDFMGRYYMSRLGFGLATFVAPWFLVYFLLRQVAMFGQLYVFAHLELGKTVALLSAVAILLTNAVGILFLKETLSPLGYTGVILAITSVLILAFK
jgi:multidrug transporter EmrE-like cation transporter